MSFPAPFERFEGEVRPEWIDSNDHMNLAYYVLLFDHGTDAIYRAVGLGPEYRRTGHGTFAVETHTIYEQELLSGQRMRVTTQILAADAKRIHLAHAMYRLPDGKRCAMQEVLLLHVDLAARRVVPWLAEVRARVQEAANAHAALPRPDWAGRMVGFNRSAARTPPPAGRG